MTVTKLTEKIYKEYPKVKNKLEIFLDMYDPFEVMGLYYNKSDGTIILSDSLVKEIIPFFMLYGLLEDFFEDNGIHIEIFLENRIDRQYWNYQIRSYFLNCGSGILYLDKKIYTKNEAKIQAVLKACEILEQGLK